MSRYDSDEEDDIENNILVTGASSLTQHDKKRLNKSIYVFGYLPSKEIYCQDIEGERITLSKLINQTLRDNPNEYIDVLIPPNSKSDQYLNDLYKTTVERYLNGTNKKHRYHLYNVNNSKYMDSLRMISTTKPSIQNSIDVLKRVIRRYESPIKDPLPKKLEDLNSLILKLNDVVSDISIKINKLEEIINYDTDDVLIDCNIAGLLCKQINNENVAKSVVSLYEYFSKKLKRFGLSNITNKKWYTLELENYEMEYELNKFKVKHMEYDDEMDYINENQRIKDLKQNYIDEDDLNILKILKGILIILYRDANIAMRRATKGKEIKPRREDFVDVFDGFFNCIRIFNLLQHYISNYIRILDVYHCCAMIFASDTLNNIIIYADEDTSDFIRITFEDIDIHLNEYSFISDSKKDRNCVNVGHFPPLFIANDYF